MTGKGIQAKIAKKLILDEPSCIEKVIALRDRSLGLQFSEVEAKAALSRVGVGLRKFPGCIHASWLKVVSNAWNTENAMAGLCLAASGVPCMLVMT